MAGLLDRGPTALEILTAKRNQIFADLQEQLRKAAASRSNNPVLAGGMTDLGAAFGRALAGRVGGEDPEEAKARAEDEIEAEKLKEFMDVSNDPEAIRMLGAKYVAAGDVEYGKELVDLAKGLQPKKARVVASPNKRELQFAKDILKDEFGLSNGAAKRDIAAQAKEIQAIEADKGVSLDSIEAIRMAASQAVARGEIKQVPSRFLGFNIGTDVEYTSQGQPAQLPELEIPEGVTVRKVN
jgi:hypothetical protein